MTRDEPEIATEEFAHAPANVAVGRAVETVPADPEPLLPLQGNRIRVCSGWQTLVEGGLEHPNQRHGGGGLGEQPDGGDVRGVVGARDETQLVHLGQHRVGETHRAGDWSSVHHLETDAVE